MITLVICIVSVIVLLAVACYILFTPHNLRICVINNVTRVWFGAFKVADSSKKKSNKKTKEKNSYVKVPTPETVKKICKSAVQVYAAEKDEALFVIKEIIANCRLISFDSSLTYGTGNAAVTAVLYGLGWQLISVIYTKVIKTEELRKTISIAFTPDYENLVLDYKIDFTLKITVIKHLRLLLRGYKIIKRNKEKFI